MEIKIIKPKLAEEFLKLQLKLDNETKFMMLEPGERNITVEQLKARLSLSNEESIFFGIEDDDELVGFISVTRGAYKRIRHTAYIVVGIQQKYSGKGLGMKLFQEVEKWALKCNVSRLELTVMSHNERAIKLYEKMGFYKEGTKEKAMLIDGVYINEYYMAKLL